jgi:hypothetical protein
MEQARDARGRAELIRQALVRTDPIRHVDPAAIDTAAASRGDENGRRAAEFETDNG